LIGFPLFSRVSPSLAPLRRYIQSKPALPAREKMGRTVPSYRIAIEQELSTWKSFRDALRKEDRELFDSLADQCRLFASAGGMAVRPIVLDSMFMCILLGHQRMISQLSERISQIEDKLRNEPSDSGKITAYTQGADLGGRSS
jgi:hypothetical protein